MLIVLPLRIDQSRTANNILLGPIAFWNFNTVQNNTVQNFFGDQLPAHLYNCTVSPGLNNNSVNLNGYDSYVQVNDSQRLHVAYISISLWFKPTAYNTMARLIGKGTETDETFGIYLNETSLGYYLYIGRNHVLNGGGPFFIQSNFWHNIIYIFAGTVENLYLDGNLVFNTTFIYQPLINNTEPLILGTMKNTNTLRYLFNGSIDQVRIYNRSLSSTEAIGLYFTDRPISSEITTNQILPADLSSNQQKNSSIETSSNKKISLEIPIDLINQIVGLSIYSLIAVTVMVSVLLVFYYSNNKKKYDRKETNYSFLLFIKNLLKKSKQNKDVARLSKSTLKSLEEIIDENK